MLQLAKKINKTKPCANRNILDLCHKPRKNTDIFMSPGLIWPFTHTHSSGFLLGEIVQNLQQKVWNETMRKANE